MTTDSMPVRQSLYWRSEDRLKSSLDERYRNTHFEPADSLFAKAAVSDEPALVLLWVGSEIPGLDAAIDDLPPHGWSTVGAFEGFLASLYSPSAVQRAKRRLESERALIERRVLARARDGIIDSGELTLVELVALPNLLRAKRLRRPASEDTPQLVERMRAAGYSNEEMRVGLALEWRALHPMENRPSEPELSDVELYRHFIELGSGSFETYRDTIRELADDSKMNDSQEGVVDKDEAA